MFINRQKQMTQKNRFSSNKGFSLLEILIVIAIMAILVTMAALNFIGLRERGYRSALLADLDAVDKAIALYYDKYGIYPLIDVLTGTARNGAVVNTILLETGSTSSRDDFYNGKTVRIVDGTCDGDIRTIVDYNGTTNTATVSQNWSGGLAPDSTSEYILNTGIEISEIPALVNTNNIPAVLKSAGVSVMPVDSANANFMAFVKKTAFLLKGYETGDMRGAGMLYYVESALAVRSGIAQDGDSETLTLENAGPSSYDDFYIDCTISITGGKGIGQSRMITDYNGSSKVVTISSEWVTEPDSTSTYTIWPPVKTGDLLFIQTATTETLKIKTEEGKVIYKY